MDDNTIENMCSAHKLQNSFQRTFEFTENK